MSDLIDGRDAMKVVDADAHVVESARSWDYMDPSERKYRPVSLETREEAGIKLQFWGFIEASSPWLPWVLHEARNRFKTLEREGPGKYCSRLGYVCYPRNL